MNNYNQDEINDGKPFMKKCCACNDEFLASDDGDTICGKPECIIVEEAAYDEMEKEEDTCNKPVIPYALGGAPDGTEGKAENEADANAWLDIAAQLSDLDI